MAIDASVDATFIGDVALVAAGPGAGALLLVTQIYEPDTCFMSSFCVPFRTSYLQINGGVVFFVP